jgi:hypothetical protein
MTLDTSTTAYIARIRERLAEPRLEFALYAALELRCAVEGRMKQYLEPLSHIPKAHKKEWSVVKLGRNINSAFKVKEQIATFTICLTDPPEMIELRYIPVSSRLQDITNKLGDYLHFPSNENLASPESGEALRAMVHEGLAWLEFAASGELMGVPLINQKTQETNLQIAFAEDDHRFAILLRVKQGAQHVIKVDYFPLPKTPPVR